MESYINGGKGEPISVFRRDGSARTAGAVTASSGGYTIADTATSAKVGDIYRAETATTAVMVGKEYKVIATTTNSFTIASKDIPTSGDTFYILASATPRVGNDGAAVISTAGLATSANQATEITALQTIAGTAYSNGTGVSKSISIGGADSGGNFSTLEVDNGQANVRLYDATGAAILVDGNGSLPVTANGQPFYVVPSSDGSTGLFGQLDSSRSIPVVICSDQTAIHTIIDSSATLSVTDTGISAVTGPRSPNSAANNSFLVGAIYNSGNASQGGVTLTNLQQAALQVTSTSQLLVMPYGRYNSGGTSVSNGNAVELQINSSGYLHSNIASINNVAPLMGNGVTGTGSLRVTLASDTTSNTNPLLFNQSQINGVALSSGNGVAGTGVQRVTIASDNTAFSVNATLSAETTKVIGTVNISAAQTIAAVTAITNALPAGTNAIGTVSVAGKISANAPARNDYTSTGVTTSAYVQLVASTTSACTEVEIFDSSGQTLVFAVGAAASEVNKFNIFPGGNGRVPLAIPAGSRVSIKAVSATASLGEINVNFYG